MRSQMTKRTKRLWFLSVAAVFSLTGCGMYPSKPGDWPSGSWAWWGAVLKVVSGILDFFAHLMGGPYAYALALLALTIIVRVIVLPLYLKQIKSTRAMQQLQPEVQKIRSKYKGDAQKIQEETTKLWQQYGVNPMAGCFPMLIQLPVLYALFGAIEGNKGLNASHFLWIQGSHTLATPDPYYILPILAGITTYLSSRVMMTTNDSSQKMMLYIMPVFIVLIGSRMAAGLALYWTYSNLFTAVQGYFVRVKPADAAAAAAVAGAPPGRGNKSGDSKVITTKADTVKVGGGKPKTRKQVPTQRLTNSAEDASKGKTSGEKGAGSAGAPRGSSSQRRRTSQSAGKSGQNRTSGSKKQGSKRNSPRVDKNS